VRIALENVDLFNGEAPQWLISGIRAHVPRGEMAGIERVNLDVRRAELIQVFVEVFVPLIDYCA